jgi:MFS family permease
VTLVTTRGSQIYSTTVGGWLGDHTAFQIPFLASAAVCLTVLVLAFWHPKTIFRSGDELLVKVVPEGSMEAIRRLIRHKAIYLPAVVLFLWEFAPGWGTPLFYYLTNQVHLSESAYGATKGWQQLGTVTAALSYGWLCKHIRFRTLLYIGTFVGVLGGPIFLLIHSPAQANIISLLAGGSCGLALASYFDLLVRSCPDELEGVAFMLTYATFTFASDGSDIFGGWLYDRGGFGLALAISTAFTALIFLPVSLVPKKISDPEEGEPITDSDPPVAEFVTS